MGCIQNNSLNSNKNYNKRIKTLNKIKNELTTNNINTIIESLRTLSDDSNDSNNSNLILLVMVSAKINSKEIINKNIKWLKKELSKYNIFIEIEVIMTKSIENIEIYIVKNIKEITFSLITETNQDLKNWTKDFSKMLCKILEHI